MSNKLKVSKCEWCSPNSPEKWRCKSNAPKKKERRIKAWTVVIPPKASIAFCACHDGQEMLMVSKSKKSAEGFMESINPEELQAKVVECEISYKLN